MVGSIAQTGPPKECRFPCTASTSPSEVQTPPLDEEQLRSLRELLSTRAVLVRPRADRPRRRVRCGGIIGALRAWTVAMISAVSIPCR
jgi:hypothetical protein